MNRLNLAIAASWFLGGVVAVRALPALAQTQLPPVEIHFCAANCFTLTLMGGQYVRQDGTQETWTIEHFSSDSVILHRHDAPAVWNGYKTDVIYAGQVSNDRLVGLTVAGDAAPSMAMAWGRALDSVPANNAERDHPVHRRTGNASLMHMPLSGIVAASSGQVGPSTAVTPPLPVAPTPALPAAPAGAEAAVSRVYVLTGGPGMNTTELLTYTLDGVLMAPHIVLANQKSVAMTADARGELYISHNNVLDYLVAAYKADGTIDSHFAPIAGSVQALAVSPAGNLYTLEQFAPLHSGSSTGIVRAYTPEGRSIGAAIDTHVAGATCLTVDIGGTIYVAGQDDNVVETFDASGQRLALTLKDGIARPMAIAVDRAGKIYVVNANNNTLTTYSHDGQRTSPTIKSFNNLPTGVALDAAGHIYVGVGRTLGIYSPNGELIKYFGEVPVSIHSIALH